MPVYEDRTKPEYTASPDNPTEFIDTDEYNKRLNIAREWGMDAEFVPVPVLDSSKTGT